jgi:hypothetical protein
MLRKAEVFDFEYGMRSIDQDGFKITPVSALKVLHFILVYLELFFTLKWLIYSRDWRSNVKVVLKITVISLWTNYHWYSCDRSIMGASDWHCLTFLNCLALCSQIAVLIAGKLSPNWSCVVAVGNLVTAVSIVSGLIGNDTSLLVNLRLRLETIFKNRGLRYLVFSWSLKQEDTDFDFVLSKW